MDCIVRGVAKSRTRLKDLHFTSRKTKEEKRKHLDSKTGTQFQRTPSLQSLDCSFYPLGGARVLIKTSVSRSVVSDSATAWPVATPWTVACQAPLSSVFPRQKYWGGLPFQSPGDLFEPGINPASLASPTLQPDSFPLSHQGKRFKPNQNTSFEKL